jgi:hypothetical protein
MSKVINLEKILIERTTLPNITDVDFKTFIQPITDDSTLSIEEFFNQYEELFFDIPKQGNSNSHEYIIQKSSDYINYQKSTEDIQPLLDEIASLRQQLLQANLEIIELRK